MSETWFLFPLHIDAGPLYLNGDVMTHIGVRLNPEEGEGSTHDALRQLLKNPQGMNPSQGEQPHPQATSPAIGWTG